MNYASIFRILFKRNFSTNSKLKHQGKELQINVRNQTINYLKAGNGAKHILCLPGALGTIWSDFRPQIERLDVGKFTVFALDPAGYGKSRPPERKFSRKFHEEDADITKAFLKEIGIDKVSLLGWSDGGISSIILAAKYPECVENLIIWGANSHLVPDDVTAYNNIRDLSKWSARAKAPLIETYTEKGLQSLWENWCKAMDEINANGGDICTDSLSKIKCPTLILHGNKDPLIAREHPDYLCGKIKGAKLHRFPDGKHNIHIKYASEFNQLVTNFILKC